MWSSTMIAACGSDDRTPCCYALMDTREAALRELQDVFTLRRWKRLVAVELTDTGIGIDTNALARIVGAGTTETMRLPIVPL